jgi:hypothetical protein
VEPRTVPSVVVFFVPGEILFKFQCWSSSQHWDWALELLAFPATILFLDCHSHHNKPINFNFSCSSSWITSLMNAFASWHCINISLNLFSYNSLHPSLAVLHLRNKWAPSSLTLLHTGKIGSRSMPLCSKLSLWGRLLWEILQTNNLTFVRHSSFQMEFQSKLLQAAWLPICPPSATSSIWRLAGMQIWR